MVLAGVSFVGVFIVLMLLFPSARIVLQILNALPTAFVGGVLALIITGQDLTVASLVGFISLGGIAVRNGIRSIPTLVLFRDGNEIARAAGVMDLQNLIAWAEHHLGA